MSQSANLKEAKATEKRTVADLDRQVELLSKKRKLSANIHKSLNVLTSITGASLADTSAALFSADAAVKGACACTSPFFRS